MTKVAITYVALHFNARRAETFVFRELYSLGVNGLGKTWPTALRFKFCARIEEYRFATSAGIDAWLMSLAVLSAERAFRSLISANLKFFKR